VPTPVRVCAPAIPKHYFLLYIDKMCSGGILFSDLAPAQGIRVVINCVLTVKTKKKKKKKKTGDGIRSDERMQNFRVYSFRVEDEMKKDNEKKKRILDCG
jgi:hypothetical protein